jgi:hypothetical protein
MKLAATIYLSHPPIKEIVEEAIGFELDDETFLERTSLLKEVSDGLIALSSLITPDIEPCFLRIPVS